MRRGEWRRLAAVAVCAVAFGVAMSVLKGNGAGVRADVGNLSAPWLLLPFVASAVASDGRLVRGMLVGLGASLLALLGFYTANSVVLQLGAHSWIDALRLSVTSGTYWYVRALFSGPIFGALGSLWRRSGAWLVGVCAFALLIAEPLAQLALAGRTVSNYYVGSPIPAVLWGEALVGVAACSLVYWCRRRPSLSRST